MNHEPMTKAEVEVLCHRLKNALLSQAEWEEKLFKVREEALSWKNKYQNAQEKLVNIELLLRQPK